MRSARGFSLIELLVVIGMSALILSVGGVMSLGSLRASDGGKDRDALLHALVLARDRAQSGACSASSCPRAQAHGVHMNAGAFIVFAGDSFASRDPSEDFPFPYDGSSVTGWLDDPVFFHGSGHLGRAMHIRIGSEPVYGIDISPDGRVSVERETP